MAIREVHEEDRFTLELLCELAGVARSAYYKWTKRCPTEEEKLNTVLLAEIRELHHERKGIYGYRQMKLQLDRRHGRKFNYKRIYRLMRVADIQSVIRRKKRRYIPSTPDHVAENVLNRDFHAAQPNEKWVTDITEFKYGGECKAYLSAIRDLHDGSLVAWVLGRSNNNALVFETLDQALRAEPDVTPVLHSDRGFQYTSKQFKTKLKKAGIIQSMSRVGRCIDNAPMESFWGTLKCEEFHLNTYQTFEELRKAIEAYIHYYNNERLQVQLNGLSPMEYRAKAA